MLFKYLQGAGGSQEQGNYWVSVFGGNGDGTKYATFYDVITDATGNVYATGANSFSGAGVADISLVKYNKNGELQWQKTLGSTGGDLARSIALDSAGNIYVGGYYSPSGSTFLLAKYNPSGVLQWQKQDMGSSGSNQIRDIAIDSSDNIYVCGNNNSGFVIVQKRDTSGTVLWSKYITGGSTRFGYSITTDSSGNVYLVGSVFNISSLPTSGFIVKLDSNGTILWQKAYTAGVGSTVSITARNVKTDTSGNVYVSGDYVDSGIANSGGEFVLKCNSSGSILWQRFLTVASNDDFNAGLDVDVAGNVYVSNNYGSIYRVGIVVKLDTSGTVLWRRQVTASGNEHCNANSVFAGRSGEFYFTGGFGSYDEPAFVAKLPGDGSFTGEVGNLSFSTNTISSGSLSYTLPDIVFSIANIASSQTDSTLTSATSTVLSTTSPVLPAYWFIENAGLVSTNVDTPWVELDSSGNFYVSGDITLSGSDYASVAKYNSSASIQWQKKLTVSGQITTFSNVCIDASNNVYVSGHILVSSVRKVLFAKYNSSGTLQWQNTLGGTGFDYGSAVAIDSSGNIYVAGYENSQGAGSSDGLLAKYNASGVLQWQRILGSSGGDQYQDVCVDSSGNIYAVGYHTPSNIRGLIVKYNSTGTLTWQRSLGDSTAGAIFYGVATDASGNVYVAGRATGTTGKILIVKYDSTGTVVWQRTVESGTTSFITANISSDVYGNLYVTATSLDQTWIIKLDSSGGIFWYRKIASSTGNYATLKGITTDTYGNVFLNGSFGNSNITIKLPGSGGLTGTYGPTSNFGSLVYSAPTMTSSFSTLVEATPTYTNVTSTLTAGTSSAVDGTSTFSVTKTTMQAGT